MTGYTMRLWPSEYTDSLRSMFVNKSLRYEYVLCPLCGRSKGKQRYFISNFNYRIVRCQNCKFVYQNPRPVADDIDSLYSDTVYFNLLIKYASNSLRDMKLGLKDIDFQSYERNTLSQEKTILDIGCADGIFLRYMQSRGWSCYGVEPGSVVYKIASKNKNLKIFQGELLDAHFKPAFFDIVQLNNLIEHVPNPLEVLKECHRILKQDGLLILSTPNYGCIPRLLWGNAWRDFVAIHLCFFSKKTLRETLKGIGFQIGKEVSWGSGFATGQIPNWLKRFFDRLTKKLDIGDHILVSATKR